MSCRYRLKMGFILWGRTLVFFLFSERKAMEMVRKCKRQVFPFALLDSNLFKHGILLDDLDFSISFTMCTVYIVYKQRKECTTFFFWKRPAAPIFATQGKMWLNWMMLVRETKVQLIYRQIGGFLVPHSNGGKYKFN